MCNLFKKNCILEGEQYTLQHPGTQAPLCGGLEVPGGLTGMRPGGQTAMSCSRGREDGDTSAAADFVLLLARALQSQPQDQDTVGRVHVALCSGPRQAPWSPQAHTLGGAQGHGGSGVHCALLTFSAREYVPTCSVAQLYQTMRHRDLPDPGIKLMSPILQADTLLGKPCKVCCCCCCC